MVRQTVTGVERIVRDDEIIVSKTDTKGILTYCNQTFMKFSDYKERELIGRPHNIIRHPRMPRCIFDLLWKTIASGNEIFAYVINQSQNGDYYWVFAHTTPDKDQNDAIAGYNSFRRAINRRALTVIEPLYQQLLTEESRHADHKAGMAASSRLLASILAGKEVSYEQFVLGL